MVTTRFIGRLGNSMFQIAACIGYARKYCYQWAVPHDARESRIHRVFPNIPKTDEQPRSYPKNGYDVERFNYFEIPDMGPDVLLAGFFQSWKYFEHCKEEVKELFKLQHIAGYEDYVSIHVRRGDYVKHSGSFPPIDMDYITQAIKQLDRPERFVVFSDDINWCKENINFDGHIEFSEDKTELEDLSLMASCGHHIIANSTFSWWAAYLGHNPDSIVVSPSCERGNWFGLENGIKHDVVDLLPDNWIQIKFR